MAFGSTPADSNQIPVSAVYVPNTGFKAVQGGYNFTDGSSNDSAPMVVHAADGHKATYSAGGLNLGYPPTSTDTIQLTGSATKTIRVTRFIYSNNQATASTNIWMAMYLRTAAASGGTSGSDPIAQYDSTDSGATASILRWTVKPTGLSTGGGAIFSGNFPNPALGIAPVIFDFGIPGGSKAPILRGTSQFFVVNFGGNAMPSGTWGYALIWTEE